MDITGSWEDGAQGEVLKVAFVDTLQNKVMIQIRSDELGDNAYNQHSVIKQLRQGIYEIGFPAVILAHWLVTLTYAMRKVSWLQER